MNALSREHLLNRLSETASNLNELQIAELLDFAEFVKAGKALSESSASDLETFFAKYRVDMSGFRFDRDEANER